MCIAQLSRRCPVMAMRLPWLMTQLRPVLQPNSMLNLMHQVMALRLPWQMKLLRPLLLVNSKLNLLRLVVAVRLPQQMHHLRPFSLLASMLHRMHQVMALRLPQHRNLQRSQRAPSARHGRSLGAWGLLYLAMALRLPQHSNLQRSMSLSLRLTNLVDQVLLVPHKAHSQPRPLFLAVIRLLI